MAKRLPDLPPRRAEERALTYSAQECAQGDCWDDDALQAEELDAFIAATLVAAGWESGPVPVHFDVADDDEVSGWADEVGIHLHPKLIRKWTVLHELAHYVDLRDGHGPGFRQRFAELVDVGLSLDAGRLLRSAFDEFELS